MKGIRRTFTESYLLNLTPEQKEQLEKAARIVGKKISDFVRDAVMVRVEEVNANVREAKRRQTEEAERAFVPRSPGRPRGLGIIKRETPAVVTPAPQPAPPTVVVQVAAPSPSSSTTGVTDEVDRLANFILDKKHDPFERSRREKQIEEILHADKDQNRAQILAGALKRRIEELEQQPKRSAWAFLGGR